MKQIMSGVLILLLVLNIVLSYKRINLNKQIIKNNEVITNKLKEYKDLIDRINSKVISINEVLSIDCKLIVDEINKQVSEISGK